MSFAVWLTGLPASGKSTIARALLGRLHERGLRPALLESDALRALLTPVADYSERERQIFYGALAALAAWLVAHGVPVIVDATAHQRAWRDAARATIGHFAEVHVDCPPEVCAARDPKGLYRLARAGETRTLPGAGVAYEPPTAPELIVASDRITPVDAAQQIVAMLDARGWLQIC